MSTTDEVRECTNARMRRCGKWISAFMPLCLCAFLTSGCLRAHARTQPDVPLAMPAPPPRVVEVSDPELPPIVSLPEEPVRDALPRPRPTPPPQRSDARPPEAPRPDPPGDASKPAEDVLKPPAPPTLQTTLQTTPVQQEGEAERRIRTLLTQTTTDLNRINTQALNADARTQFDTARRFVSQAEDALRAKNLVFARNLADKASVLAAQLAGR